MSLLADFDWGEIPKDVQEKLSAYVDEKHGAAIEAEKLSFKGKMNGLDAKLKAAQELAARFDGIDADEIPVLRAAKGKNGELEAALSELKKNYATKEKALEEKEAQLKKLDFSQKLNQAIHQHNTQNPAVSVRDDMADVLAMIAAQRVTEIDGHTVYTKNDGSPIVKDSGYGDASAFIEHLRSERPSLFNAPTGGGAAGSSNTLGSATKGDFAGDKKARANAIAERFNLPVK